MSIFEFDPIEALIRIIETPENKKIAEKAIDSYNQYFLWSEFKKNTPAEKRLKDSIKIVKQHPNCIPIIVQINSEKEVHKLLVNENTLVSQFLISLRRNNHMILKSNVACFVFNDEGSIIRNSQTLREVYEQYMLRHNIDDYFLHLRISEENTFG